jgi:hypothetical protein
VSAAAARLAVLTTDTAHHRYFVEALAPRCEVAGILVEEAASAPPPFAVAHPSDDERDAYERDVLLGGRAAPLEATAPVLAVASVNDGDAVRWLGEQDCDVVVAFGVGLIGAAAIAAVRGELLNLHGGNPEEYRGLDTLLWAVYHRDFANLMTSLHVVAPELDTGDIVGQAAIPLQSGMPIAQLRARNTEVCVDLVSGALATLTATGRLPRRPQLRRGRYYSAMPAVLKDTCVRQFDRHVAGL